MTPDLYLDLTIGGTGGAGTSGDPYRSFADIPAYAGGAAKNILVTGSTGVSGTQNIPQGYTYYAATPQIIGDFGDANEVVLDFTDVAYETILQNLIFRGRIHHDTVNNEKVTFNWCRFQRGWDSATSWQRFSYARKAMEFNQCAISGKFGSPSLNQSILSQGPSAGQTNTFNRCLFYIHAYQNGNGGLFTGSYTTDNLSKCMLHVIEDANSPTALSQANNNNFNQTDCYRAGDAPSALGTAINGDDFLFVDPINHNLELLDNSPVHLL